MAAELVDHLAILVAVRRMGATDSRSLRSESYNMSPCHISFVDLLLLFPFVGF
jgi:hypothetical protein